MELTKQESATVDNFFSIVARLRSEDVDDESRAGIMATFALMFEQYGLLLRPYRKGETLRYTHFMSTGELS